MKALVIAPQPFFSPRGTPLSVYYRTLVESELGVDIDLLTYGEGEDIEIPRVRIIRIPRFKSLGPVKVGPSYLKFFLDFFVFLWTIGLLLRRRYDFIHAHEEAVFFCRLLKPVFRSRLIYDMHSSLPQQLINFRFTSSRILINLVKRLEGSCIRSADAIITICPDLLDHVRKLISNGKCTLIENSLIDPIGFECPQDSIPPETSAYCDRGRRLVVYAGTLESYQGIDILIKAFSKVTSECREACLLLVGGSKSQVRHYSTLVRSLNLESNVHLTGQTSQAMARYYCSLASVLVSPRCSGSNTPLKIYEQLASGIPLVATRIYSHTQVLDDQVAILVEPEPEALARGILTALMSGEEARLMAENAKRLYRERYSRQVYEYKMRRVLSSLMKQA